MPFFGGEEEKPMTILDRLKLFFPVHWRGVVIVLTPIIMLFIIMPQPAPGHKWVAYTLVVMAIYWMTECLPLPVTSFIPVFVFPFANVMDTERVCRCYFNDTIMMFVGNLMLAASVEQSGLHRRLALLAVRMIGYSHYKLLGAMCIVTTFVSMWITNTAATTMMVPINFALLKVFEDQKLLKVYETDAGGNTIASDLTTCYFCAATYSATIGGIGTLVGTGTNLVFRGLYMAEYPTSDDHLAFPKFSAFTVPYMICMEITLYLCMILVYLGWLRPKSEQAKAAVIPPDGIKAAAKAVNSEIEKLGKISSWEISVAILFSVCMVMFFLRSPQIFTGWGDGVSAYFQVDKKFIKDSVCAMCFVMLMFWLPNSCGVSKNCTAKYADDLPKTKQRSILNFTKMDAALPYSFCFLLGGGFALSTAAGKDFTNLNAKIAEALAPVSILPVKAVVLVIILLTVFITNFASNVAVCNVVAPIAMALARQIKAQPLLFDIAAGLSASYCFMLPVGTPGNLIVQSAASIPTAKMIKAGFLPTVFTIFWTWVFLVTYAPVIWPILDSKELPDAATTTKAA